MARVDLAVVNRLVSAALEQSGLITRHIGEESGSHQGVLAKLTSLDVSHRGEARDGGPHHVNIVATVRVSVSPQRMATEGSYALSRAISNVSRVLTQATLRDEDSGHQVDFMDDADEVIDAEPDEQTQVSTGAVIVRGVASRLAGADVETG